MRDSIRISLNLESRSFLLVSRCLRTATAFLTRCQRSSGIDGPSPISRKMTRKRTWKRVITMGLEDTEYFVTGDETDLRYAVRVSEGDTDL